MLGGRYLRPTPRASSGYRPLTVCRAEPTRSPSSGLFTDPTKYANPGLLDQAARRYQIGLEQGFEEDELLALELGVSSISGLTEAQKAYKDKIQQKLAKRAAELKAEEDAVKERLARNLELGKKAYECGEYPASVRLLEQAVRDVGPDTVLGGEAQLWLGLAYQACGRDQDAIAVYKEIEASHPSRKVKKQAGELRYILEAPRLELREDERVKIPLIQSDSWRQKQRTSYTPKLSRPAASSKKNETYWDRVSLDAPDPLAMLPDRWYVRVAFAVVLLGAIIYVNYAATGR
ncbi:hypothetical protein PLESTB_001479500 [Pleodorina starrii]|uniref:Uncharacterized protein n=1 Tax=Pleodorina starrii TaxID=330485 RepID=A0A9W6BVU7_9CHLO|nr:hypothetical protein PLESTM_000651000 [Pleodorina starrii]GLC59374.1 hypothetical protein PLESTB_001479500 [Pleodorina starrii]GLC74427.1 hypothetical protein PLESTF_001511800 [Pleodorina starrii]